MKILFLDIETSPTIADVWGLWQQNVGLNQIRENGRILCWAAKWRGDKKVHFGSVRDSSEKVMLHDIHRLVSEADCIVHYNGKKFDVPTLNREWLRHGFKPPAPHKDIDLLETAKRRFRFISNKLAYVSQYLGIGAKEPHNGHEVWVGCMAGDKKAWAVMERYNKQDVVLLERLYDRLLPWLDRHPAHGAWSDEMVCPKCGSDDYQSRGRAFTTTLSYKRYQCNGCDGWFRGHRTVSTGRERAVNVAG